MGRQIPTTNEPCDGCGATSEENVIYDCMGDYLCCECITASEEPACTMCEDPDVIECCCGSMMCKRCLSTYGDHCPGCGK
jgi:hypothetical protein